MDDIKEEEENMLNGVLWNKYLTLYPPLLIHWGEYGNNWTDSIEMKAFKALKI